MSEKIFTDGLRFELPNDKAPEFIKGKLSIKVAEFIEFLNKHESNGWVNIDLKIAKSGKCYGELNTWKPNNKNPNGTEKQNNPEQFKDRNKNDLPSEEKVNLEEIEYPEEEINPQDIPF